MWLERFLIIVPGLAHKPLSQSWGTYSPQWVEISIMAGSIAAMGLLYVLFSKVVPIISIWEMRAGEREMEHMKEGAEHKHAEVTAGGVI